MNDNKQKYHDYLSQMLDDLADEKTAVWFTNYLKGEIKYRGLKTGMLKNVLSKFFVETGANTLSISEQLVHIRYWLAKPMAEDKLIALLWLQDGLKFNLKYSKDSSFIDQALDLLEDTFQKGDIHDWSTNDWLCVRFLEIIPEKYPQYIPRLINWSSSNSKWQRRSSILSFKKSGKNGKFFENIEQLIKNLLPSDERFIQTAIGWVLSDISRKYPEKSLQLFEEHFMYLSHEVIVRHAKYLPNYQNLKNKSRKNR